MKLNISLVAYAFLVSLVVNPFLIFAVQQVPGSQSDPLYFFHADNKAGKSVLCLKNKQSNNFDKQLIKEAQKQDADHYCLEYYHNQPIMTAHEDQLVCRGKLFLDNYFEESFDTAMVGKEEEFAKYHNFLKKTSDKLFLGVVRDQYHRFVENIEGLYSQEPRIPKIIHQIWVGPHPFPSDALEWQASWQKLHPDWEYKLWTNKEVAEFEFANKVYYNQAKNWGEKADILRLELIYQFGGLYVDIDQKCFKPFDVLHHTCDFYTAMHQLPLMVVHNNKFRIANGVMAAAPGHPIFKHAVEQIKNNRHHAHLLDRSGPDYFTKIIKQKLDDSRRQGNIDIVFPANYFYPYGKRINNVHNIKPQAEIYVKPETMAVHYYTSYWLTPPTK